jgi:IclR family transcriptional regulator, acetate operon repressor
MTSASTQAGAGIGGGATGTQAISRTLAVLQLFQQNSHDLGISEIAEQLSLSVSTVHRIVRALATEGYLAQNEETERYYLGRSAVLLGQAATERLGLHRAQLVLDRVREETGESVNLGVRDGDEMVVVIRAESTHPLRFSQQPGSRLPVYATAMGKASLSHGARTIEQEAAALRKPLRPLTPKTITSARRLREELERIRARGYSIDDEEALDGVRCVAAPILSQGRLLAAVAVQGPAVRMPRKRLEALAPVVRRAAEEIAQVIPSLHDY